MIAKKLKLHQFRNIEDAEISFSEGVNVLYGDNAEGKTNLLEALYYTSIGKSFRGQHVSELLRFGTADAQISLDYNGAGRDQTIKIQFFEGRVRTVEKNRVKLGRMSELVGAFKAVLFCPEHLSLIKDGPAERRQFLDIAISALEPAYLSALQRYNRILKQRNTLLKGAEKNPADFRDTVNIWSMQLAKEGAYIAKSRERYVKRATRFVEECFFDMTGEREKPTLVYHGCGGKELDTYEDVAKTEAVLYKRLCENHEREIGAGATLYGIHKDDLEVYLNGRAARIYCSQGQQRSLALALKIAEGELCREDCGEYPVLLFDDVLSELDENRRAYLLNKIKGKQVILTTCEKEEFNATHRIFVKGGTYHAETE